VNLGNQVEWALHCLSVLASAPEGKFVPAQVLSEFHRIPKEYLSKALQELAKAGIVEGKLGPKGGYRLARPADRITFLDVVEAVEGNTHSFRCTEIRRNIPATPKNLPEGPCVIADVMYRAEHAWRVVLRETTIADIHTRLDEDVSPKVLEKSKAWLLKQLG